AHRARAHFHCRERAPRRPAARRTARAKALRRRPRERALLVLRGRNLDARLRARVPGRALAMSPGRLGLAILLGPVTWLVCLEADYALVPWACSRAEAGLAALFAVGAVALAAARRRGPVPARPRAAARRLAGLARARGRRRRPHDRARGRFAARRARAREPRRPHDPAHAAHGRRRTAARGRPPIGRLRRCAA